MVALKEGQKAPAFKGVDQNGKKVSLTDFKGKWLILYFYPRSFTPTCTVEACNLRDNYSVLRKKGFEIVGVSGDEESVQKKFEEKHELPFTLLADADHKICEAYGVWGKKKLYGKEYMGIHRTTFVIDDKGVINKIFLKPKSNVHAQEIIEALK